MAQAPIYQVVFNGQLRSGFERQQVAKAFNQRLKFPPKRVAELFNGKTQVLKSTASQDEAKKLVTLLASLGASASIQVKKAAAKKAPQADSAPPTKVSPPSTALHEFSPYSSDTTLKSAASIAIASELFLLGGYLLLLLFFSVGLLHATFFTTWGISVVGFGPLALLLQILMLPLGLLVLLFLVKPLLVLRQQHRQGMVMTPEQEARLHTFVQSICDKLQLPIPQQLRLNNGVTVEVEYLGGFVGLLLNRTVLTIGAPLVAASQTSQLAAYTAHALQLFHSNKLSSRSANLIRLSDSWLQRAINEEDAIDRLLTRLIDDNSPYTLLANPMLRIIDLSRRALQWRLRFSRRINRRLFHTLIAEADQAALNYCGSDGFATLLQQQRLLELAQQQTLPTLSDRWYSQGTLPDNLTQLLRLRSGKYPPTMAQQLRDRQEEEKVASADPIPADSQRIEHAISLKVTPSTQGSAAASALLRNFTKVARQLTLRLYHTQLHLQVTSRQLVPSATTATQRQQQQQIDAIFKQLHQPFIPLQLQRRIQAIAGYDKGIEQLKAAKQQISSTHSKAEHAQRSFSDTTQALFDISTEESIYRAALAKEWGLPTLDKGGLDSLQQACHEQQQAQNETVTQFAKQLAPYVQRLAASLALLNTPQGGKVGNAAALQQEVKKLSAVLAGIEKSAEQLRTLQLQNALLQPLLSFDSGNSSRKHHRRMRDLAGTIRQLVSELGSSLKALPYPFANGTPQDLGSYALRNAYQDASPAGEYDRGNDMVEQVAQVETQALARLCAIALHVEKALAL